jgi:hypothetical protein
LPAIVDLSTSGSVSQYLANHFSLLNIYVFNICWFVAFIIIFRYRRYIYFVSAFLGFLPFLPWTYHIFKNMRSADEKSRVKSISRLKIASKLFPALRMHISMMMCKHVCALTTTDEYIKSHPNSPSQDVQDILDFHSMDLDVSLEKIRRNYGNHLIFSKAFLRGARLSGRSYLGFDFRGSDLAEANLEDSLFMSCFFFKSNLIKSRFAKSRIVSAHFEGAFMDQSVFTQADLFNTFFIGTQLRLSDFSGATFTKVNFDSACLSGATLPLSIEDEDTVFNLPSNISNVEWVEDAGASVRRNEFLETIRKELQKYCEELL